MNYQPLFDLMHNEHGLTLLESEMSEIIRCVETMNPSKTFKSLEYLLGLKEHERKEWADMCIRKQARIEELEGLIKSMTHMS